MADLWFCRVLFFCTRTMGAVGARPSLCPLSQEGEVDAKLGRMSRREDAPPYLRVMARRRLTPPNQNLSGGLDASLALAMTARLLFDR